MRLWKNLFYEMIIMKIVVGITGASGVIYGIRLLEELKKADIETYLVISDIAKDIIEYETSYLVCNVEKLASYSYDEHDLNAIINSGSFKFDATIIIPSSISFSYFVNFFNVSTFLLPFVFIYMIFYHTTLNIVNYL